MYKDSEDERVRKIIMDAYKAQAKRSIKVMIYLLMILFAVNGGWIVYRWLF